MLNLASRPKVSAKHQQRVEFQLAVLMVIVWFALQAEILFGYIEVSLVNEHLLNPLC